MSNIIKENLIDFTNLSINSIKNKKYLLDTLSKQKNDPIVKAIKNQDSKINFHDDIEIKDNDWKSMWEFYLDDIFTHLKENYPFIVTVPEKYKSTIIDKGNMNPVYPSDRQWEILGFKWTIWINPYIENTEKRYITEIINKEKLCPYLTWPKNNFWGVAFLSRDFWGNLKLWEDYRILGYYSWEELEKELEAYGKEKITKEISYTNDNIEEIIPRKASA